ncbi:hypothetical protein CQW23_34937 [Capsicum baccatum]|uniref:Uncharacterized protein n=1 Tax=Capsicum baccatum TaxID=33114 RepID=A0A2G2UXF0_CAPBA|nr:hypothetical protein CQW23_34937 [Capsicum baccatum]
MASGATCVQGLDGSQDPAIHTKYRISQCSSSMRDPRYPLSRVVFVYRRSTGPLDTRHGRGARGRLSIQVFLGAFRAGVRWSPAALAGVRASGMGGGARAECRSTPPARAPRLLNAFAGSFCCAGFDNDPSAGSPTETLLRLLLPLNDKVQWTSRDVAGSEPPTSPRSEHFTGSFNRLPEPVGQGYKLVEYISVVRVRPRTSWDSAIHTKYRILQCFSSMREPRYPLPRIVFIYRRSTGPPDARRGCGARGRLSIQVFLGIFRGRVRWSPAALAGVRALGTGIGTRAECRRTPPARTPQLLNTIAGSFCCVGFDNDPSAGSPTETLLRLLLPLNDKVQWTSHDVAGSEPPTSTLSEHFTGSFKR